MTKKVYYLFPCAEVELAINEIHRRIPCFSHISELAEDYFVYEIQCRDADLPFVEKMLAPFV